MISVAFYYGIIGVILFGLGFFALIAFPELLRKVLAGNVMGSGVFLVYVSLAFRSTGELPDPVPHAMVLTGIVVSVCTTALAIVIINRINKLTGSFTLPDDNEILD